MTLTRPTAAQEQAAADANAVARESGCHLADGRQLTVATYGAVDSPRTIMYHHGTGGSRWEGLALHHVATELGITVVCVDRPGAGDSTPLPDRSLADWPADLLAVADDMGIDTFVSAGISGGGPHAMAVAAAAPERVSRCMPINSGPPSGDVEVMAALDSKTRNGPVLARKAPWLFDKVLVNMMTSERLVWKLLPKQVPAEDLAVLSQPEQLATVLHAAREGRRRNKRFFAEGLLLWRDDWHFDPYALEVPVTAVTGEADPYRPFSEAVAARSADGTLLVVSGGHFVLARPDAVRSILSAAFSPPFSFPPRKDPQP